MGWSRSKEEEAERNTILWLRIKKIQNKKIKTLKMSDQRADSSLAWRRHCGRVSSKARE